MDFCIFHFFAVFGPSVYRQTASTSNFSIERPVFVSSRPILAKFGGTQVFLPHFSANSNFQFFPLKPFCHLKVFALFGRFRSSPPPLADSSEKISTEPPVFVTSRPSLASNGGTEVFLPHFSANSKLQFFPFFRVLRVLRKSIIIMIMIMIRFKTRLRFKA